MGRLEILGSGTAGQRASRRQLDSWKEIAAYFNRGVRTVQRWEQEENLPVHRLRHGKQGSVFALSHELEAWWESRGDEFPKDENGAAKAVQVVKPTIPRRTRWLVAVIALAAAGTLTWRFLTASKAPIAEPSVVQLTSYPGEEWHPRFSPDGTKLTFCYKPQGKHDYDLYVKQIGVDTPVPLVQTPASEGSAVWSPDGKFILFARNSDTVPGKYDVLRIPAIGGSEEKLTEAQGPRLGCSMLAMLCPWLAWSPEGNWIVMVDQPAPTEPLALFAFSLRTLQKHRLTTPPVGSLGDSGPSLSPDGRTLAFHRMSAGGLSEIYVLDVTGDLAPQGDPRQVTFENGHATSPEWTPDGKDLVFALGLSKRYQPSVVRIGLAEKSQPRNLPYASQGAWFPIVSADGASLAFARHSWVANLYRLSLPGSGDTDGGLSTVVRSTAVDLQPSYSPEGGRIAFSSDRAGSRGIWAADADGSNPVRLTGSDDAHDLGPRWSPGGERIAYASDIDGNRDIYVIDARGGEPTRLTSHPGEDSTPEWSKDGEWIYFGSMRSNSSQIWRIPAAGGPAIQVTKHGGARPRLTRDGESIYYAKYPIVPTAVWRASVNGDEEAEVLGSSVGVDQFALAAAGIYYIPVAEPYGSLDLKFHDFTTGTVEEVAELQEVSLNCSRCMDWNESGLAVSPDGRSILFGKVDDFDADLMLVENFR